MAASGDSTGPGPDLSAGPPARRPRSRIGVVLAITAMVLGVGLLVMAIWLSQGVGLTAPAPDWRGTNRPVTEGSGDGPGGVEGIDGSGSGAGGSGASGSEHGVVVYANLPTDCPADPVEFVATRMQLLRPGRAFQVLSLGVDDAGRASPPPASKPNALAWFNIGPKAGSRQGNVVLSSHTNRFSIALGNQLNSGLIKVGDLLRLSDDQGHAACYQYRASVKVWLKDYDPLSGVVYDYYGSPQLAWVVCSDWSRVTRRTEARIVYYADLVVGA